MDKLTSAIRTLSGYSLRLEEAYGVILHEFRGQGPLSERNIRDEVIEEFYRYRDQEVNRALSTIVKSWLDGDDIDEFFFSEAFRHTPDLMRRAYEKRVNDLG